MLIASIAEMPVEPRHGKSPTTNKQSGLEVPFLHQAVRTKRDQVPGPLLRENYRYG